jgi:hypothetical protein
MWGGSSANRLNRLLSITTRYVLIHTNALKAKIYEQLYPTLLATFLESVPALPAPLETSLCVAVASIAESLADRPTELLKRMDVYFPFSIPHATPNGVGADARLNSAYSSMAIRCQSRLDNVTDWIVDLLVCHLTGMRG